MFSRRRDNVCDAACGKLENCSICAIIRSSRFTSDAQHVFTTEVPSTLLPDPVVARSHADPVVAHDHVQMQFDEESAVDTQSDDPFQFDDPPVLSNVNFSQSIGMLYVLEDNEAVIKMIIKGRSPTMRHVLRTRVSLDWLFDRINLSKHQIADNEKRHFTRD